MKELHQHIRRFFYPSSSQITNQRHRTAAILSRGCRAVNKRSNVLGGVERSEILNNLNLNPVSQSYYMK